MIKFENSGIFVNNDIDYPFNIYKGQDFIQNFWSEIEEIITEINNDNENKLRYVWIDAGNYCQTEIFLKKILSEHHDDYHILYLHWIDFLHSDTTLYSQIVREKINNNYFLNNKDRLKICVIDHSEEIKNFESYLELCRNLFDNKCIYIFVSKTDSPCSSNWLKIVSAASKESNNIYQSIIRSEKNHFTVNTYSKEQCRNILSNASLDEDIKDKSIELINTIGDELRRPYYFDLLINELRSYSNINQMPDAFEDYTFIKKIFDKALNGISVHLNGYRTLESFMEGYKDSQFVKDFKYGNQARVPFDNYISAYGIMHCSLKVSDQYNDVLKAQFEIFDSGEIKEINNRIVLNFYSEERINNSFNLCDYFVQMINYSLDGALVCASVINENFNKIEHEYIEKVFDILCVQYEKALDNENEIYIHNRLGMELGKMLPNLSGAIVCKALNYFFKTVSNDYVEPVCNQNGVSVIPVTNYEYEYFVRDSGYSKFYLLPTRKPLDQIATSYYREIFDYIMCALNSENKKDGAHLAKLLKGYDWEQYKQIAYLYSRKEDIKNEDIYKKIVVNYPDKIEHPAKWADKSNGKVELPFCNPLQPVVGINIFEARAYAKWLESKIDKPVRVMVYDPDYLSVIGKYDSMDAGTLRDDFLTHIENQRKYINSIENDEWFYVGNDLNIKEPSPIALSNLKFQGLYDFIGNVFETQDTPFSYNYGHEDDVHMYDSKTIEEVYIDYNCASGGLQRTAANWPPKYMGQVPAFLRNQDIGFRIVIDGHPIGSQKHRNINVRHTRYSEGECQIYLADENSVNLLKKITMKCLDSDKCDFIESNVYRFNNKFAKVYLKNCLEGSYKEAVLLLSNGDNIFAYHLLGLSSIKNIGNIEIKIKIITHTPQNSDDSIAYRGSQNRLCEWIDIVEIINKDTTDWYMAYPLSISNGYFQITNRKKRGDVANGFENRKNSSITGHYQIKIKTLYSSEKEKIYNSFNGILGIDNFLPDWINIIDFIDFIAQGLTQTDKLDVETVMSAITSIDTADLHEQINKKILEKRKKNEEKNII